MANLGDSADMTQVIFTDLKVATAWTHLGLSVSLDNINTTVRAWKNAGIGTSGHEEFSSVDLYDGKTWSDSNTGYSAVIGAAVTGFTASPFTVTGTQNALQGFIYEFCIRNQETTSGSPYYPIVACTAPCPSNTCTSDGLGCMYEVDHDKDEDGNICSSTCGID